MGTTAGEGASGAVASEAREIVRQAVGDAAGLTIKAQVRQAARNLGFPPESWRPREAFYGRAGSWSAAALDDLRWRFAAWRQHEAVRAGEQGPGRVTPTHPTLAGRLDAIRAGLVDLQRQVDEMAAEVALVNEAHR